MLYLLGATKFLKHARRRRDIEQFARLMLRQAHVDRRLHGHAHAVRDFVLAFSVGFEIKILCVVGLHRLSIFLLILAIALTFLVEVCRARFRI